MSLGEGESILDRYRKRVAELDAVVARAPMGSFLGRNRHRDLAVRLRDFYRRGIARLTGEWAADPAGHTGDDYSRPEHLYERDLNILGAGSLFEHLCTARTEIGRRWLATYLLEPVEHAESVARQQAVRELSGQAGLGEDIVRLGRHDFSQCKESAFRDWLGEPRWSFFPLLPWIALLSATALVAVLVFALSNIENWQSVGGWALGLLAFQALLGFSVQERVRTMLEHARGLAPEVEILQEGLVLLARQSYTSPKLADLVERAKQAPSPLRALARWMNLVRERDSDWLYWLSIYLMFGTQLGVVIERWRQRHGAELEKWIAIWGEFEALNTLANFAQEHPGHNFPHLLPAGDAEWVGEAIGHPLLLESNCVRNDVRLDAEGRFFIVSGSNMAGKSTLLRAIGINTVLAFAGAPVRASQLRLTPLRVGASISVSDSLLEGKSRFLAEVERIRAMLEAPPPLLFLIDEIFSGTNSTDRRIAAEAVVRTLLERGAVGLLSTHDLALGSIADAAELRGSNVHMASRDDAAPLDFDYLLKPGINRQSNALAIARLAGVPV